MTGGPFRDLDGGVVPNARKDRNAPVSEHAFRSAVDTQGKDRTEITEDRQR